MSNIANVPSVFSDALIGAGISKLVDAVVTKYFYNQIMDAYSFDMFGMDTKDIVVTILLFVLGRISKGNARKYFYMASASNIAFQVVGGVWAEYS
jgi:hypothetical protein